MEWYHFALPFLIVGIVIGTFIGFLLFYKELTDDCIDVEGEIFMENKNELFIESDKGITFDMGKTEARFYVTYGNLTFEETFEKTGGR